MAPDQLDAAGRESLKETLGYLNFSSGGTDPQALTSIDRLFAAVEGSGGQRDDSWQIVGQMLRDELATLQKDASAFRDSAQAEAVLALTFERLLPAYRQHHADLLFHQNDATLMRPLFVGRALEAILQQGGPWDQIDRIVDDALHLLNDYLGHRPVAVLESDQKIEPYEHERLRPVPLYVEGVGAAVGDYAALITGALAILRETDPALLRAAWFDLESLEEIALDPRAYDFDHPVNKRPNYHFGQWDPHNIDNSGTFRRFVLQQVTLDALLARGSAADAPPPEETLVEASAALAGILLMASGTSGRGPDTHDSTTSVPHLLAHIATYRDEFYEQLLLRITGPHGERLREEAVARRQPFGGVRQHLNQELARQRARQLQHVHLAGIYSRMGQFEAATRQVNVVPVASARMMCSMHCHLTAAHLAIDRGDLADAASRLPQIEELLQRGIGCGAVVDPWNILGFDSQFSLFPSPENSLHDFRVDDLLELMERIFALYARLLAEAGASNEQGLQGKLKPAFEQLGHWWDQFASTTHSSVQGVSAADAIQSAEAVATALQAWHEAGAASGDVAFWREFVDQIQSPAGFAQVVTALLDKGDLIASMALLMQWLSLADELPLKEREASFYHLAEQWMSQALAADGDDDQNDHDTIEQWKRVTKFFDYFEANADQHWYVPQLELESAQELSPDEEPVDEDDEDEDVFGAAYEEVTYRDSTDDGLDADMAEWGVGPSDFELEAEAQRIGDRLELHSTVAALWKRAALACRGENQGEPLPDRWIQQAEENHRQLVELLAVAHRYPISTPSGSHESLVEYDRCRAIKDGLLERIIAACVETRHAIQLLRSAADDFADEDQTIGADIYRAIITGRAAEVRVCWPEFLACLAEQPLLYVPLARGGDPAKIVEARQLQHLMSDLLSWLPRMGLLSETYELLRTAQEMERSRAVGPGAVTEFDRLFDTACKSLTKCVIVSSESWQSPAEQRDDQLVECLQELTEPLMLCWLEHSRTLRLSVLEKVTDESAWEEIVAFIKRCGRELFTQRFMHFGNLRAILHQGTDVWIGQIEQNADDADSPTAFLEELGEDLPHDEAADQLAIVLEAVVENYEQYRDYNSTTTQSDRGDLLYGLLDFLRLRSDYERIAWNLRPIVLTHETLVRQRRTDAAAMWRDLLTAKTSEFADELAERLEKLSSEYGMRLPSIADRVEERFIRPLEIDRLTALMQTVFEDAVGSSTSPAFEQLETQISRFTENPQGAGFEAPVWLEALEEELESCPQPGDQIDRVTPFEPHFRPTQLPWDAIREMLDEWQSPEE
jgi:hypothetical protein